MKVVAVLGAGGGVGTTTVAAHLAAALVAKQRHTLALDFSPGNLLRLHLGMEWADETGLAPQLLSGKPWHEAAYRSGGGVDFIPFGRPPQGQSAADFWAWLRKRPNWFARRLLQLHAGTFVVCDCPSGEEAWRGQILPSSSLALIVLAPDAASYARAGEVARGAAANGAREVAFLLNGFDPVRHLDRDIASLLRHDLQPSLAPVVIHRDEAVREAFAASQTVFDYAPAGRAAFDFAALGSWVSVRVNREARVA